MRKIICYYFLFICASIVYSNDLSQDYESYLDSRKTELNIINTVTDLQGTHWIPKINFKEMAKDECFWQEIHEEFIFLANNHLLIINTGISCTYLETQDKYIFETVLISVYGEFEYRILNNEEIECSDYYIKIRNGELYIRNKNRKNMENYILTSVF